MKISLIGMSGSGKSFWAKQLEVSGFERFCIDDLIEERLDSELKRFGLRGIHDVAEWMGEPYEPQYAINSARYIALEETILGEVLHTVEKEPDMKDIVVDTTGSVVYTKKAVLKLLSELTHVVYLKISSAEMSFLYQLYLDDPKPVIWGDIFDQHTGETGLQALARCYPLLLTRREKLYEKLAEYILPASQLREQDFTVQDFVSDVREAFEA